MVGLQFVWSSTRSEDLYVLFCTYFTIFFSSTMKTFADDVASYFIDLPYETNTFQQDLDHGTK